MAGIEAGNNGEEGYKKIQMIGQVFKSNDTTFCNGLYLLFNNVGRISHGGKEYDSYTSREFISFVHNNSRMVGNFKTKYDKYKDEDFNKFITDDELKNEINKKFEEFLKIKNNIKDIFKDKDNNFCNKLFGFFLHIQPSLDESEKNLLFNKEFMQSVHDDTSLMDKFIKNLEGKKWYDFVIVFGLQNSLKKKMNEFLKNGKKTVKNERIKIIQDEFDGGYKFCEELYKILDDACSNVKLDGKKDLKRKSVKEQEEMIKEQNRKIIFSGFFMSKIHNNVDIEGQFRKNGGKFNHEIRKLIKKEAEKYIQICENVRKSHEEKHKAEAEKGAESVGQMVREMAQETVNEAKVVESKTIDDHTDGMVDKIILEENPRVIQGVSVFTTPTIPPEGFKQSIDIHFGQDKYNGDKFSILFKREYKKYNEIKGFLNDNGGLNFKDEYISAYILYQRLKRNETLSSNEKIRLYNYRDEIKERSDIVEGYLKNIIYHNSKYFDGVGNITEEDKNKFLNNTNKYIKQAHELSKKFSNISTFEESQLIEFDKIVDQIQKDMSSFGEADSGILYLTNRLENYLKTEAIDDNDKIGVAILFARILQWEDVRTEEDIQEFIDTIKGKDTKYKDRYEIFLDERTERDYEQETERVVRTLTERYERAQKLAEAKKYYESDFSVILKTDTDSQNPSGLQIASGIDNIQNKLNHYKIKSNRTEHENTALKYTAFDITFNNAFNLNDPTIQKLADLKIDLRSGISSYGIYNPDNNSFNKIARDRFVADKLLNKGLTIEEIENLGKTMEGLPSDFEKNYEVLCGNFDADQDTFEKITKIYALGEVIDKIKTLFSDLNSEKLGNFMGLELDKDNPADIVGDCLFLKGKINGTEANIKYDLRTGKIYMNSFTSESINPPRIVVGNTKPDTEIGDFGSFEEAISKLDSTFPIQNSEDQGNNVKNTNTNNYNDGNKPEDTNNPEQNGQASEKLIKSKLSHDLKEIGQLVKEKAGEQGEENNVIDKLLKTFNITPESGEPSDVEFVGKSNLFILLESIKNTNDESDLIKFSNLMNELMSLCRLSWGKNNENPSFSSISIFDIAKDNASEDIIFLQDAHESFFSSKDGEKDKLKNKHSHFDASTQLSFANIIVQKCCRDTGDGRKILTTQMESFVESIKNGIADGKDLADCENKLNDESIFENNSILA